MQDMLLTDNALELHLSCIKPSQWCCIKLDHHTDDKNETSFIKYSLEPSASSVIEYFD